MDSCQPLLFSSGITLAWLLQYEAIVQERFLLLDCFYPVKCRLRILVICSLRADIGSKGHYKAVDVLFQQTPVYLTVFLLTPYVPLTLSRLTSATIMRL